MDSEWGIDPVHAILPGSCEYEIIGLRLELFPEDGTESYLDLVLRRDAERVVLRFWSPQELEIERGGPRYTSGFMVYDISRRQMEGLGVRVDDGEGSHGRVKFCARDVERIQ
jgi:hypothetical protein